MQRSNVIRRTLLGTLAAAALIVLAATATACTTTTSAAPTTTPEAPVQATAPTAPTSHMVPPASSAATAGKSAAPAGPTASAGKTVVAQDCVGACHGKQLLGYRTSPSTAQRIASSMGRRVGLNADNQQAVALFLAQ